MNTKEPMKEIKFTIPDISEVEIENVVEVLRSGWITTGPKLKFYMGVKGSSLEDADAKNAALTEAVKALL